MNEAIRAEHRDGWRKITLNRPDKLNAVNEAMLGDLLAAFDAAEADRTCRAVLLTGEGRGFCAGQELGPAVMPGPDGPPDLEKLAGTWHHRVTRRIRALPLPVVCAVNGVAAGAGASFALACDIVLAARSAKFVQAFVKIGLVPDSGASFLLTHTIGEARARALAMLGEAVDAERAEAWGMIWKAVDDAVLVEEAEKLTASLARAPTEALARMKRMFASAATNGLDAQLDLEARLQGESGRTADYAEGVRAFLDKRAPVFRGAGVTGSVAPLRARAEAMWAKDHASASLGMRLQDVAPGRALLSLTVTEAMANSHGICHGGFIFALADSAMAYAANPCGETAVAQHATITFLRPARVGEVLVAEAEERARAGRSGMYDVRVSNEGGELVAEFRGHTRAVGNTRTEGSGQA